MRLAIVNTKSTTRVGRPRGSDMTSDSPFGPVEKTDVARWLVRVLAEAGVFDVDDGRPLRLRAR